MARNKKQTVGRRVARPGRNARASEKMQINLRRRLLSRTVLVVAVAIILAGVGVGGGLALYYKAYANPRRVFNDMINNNLATRGFVKQMIKNQSGNTSVETLQLEFSPDIRVRDVRNINLPASRTNVTVETIGTTTADYQHYLHITKLSSAGKPADYSRVYGLWVKNGEGEGGAAELVNSAFFGATLLGNLDPATRHKVTVRLAPAYIVDYKNVVRSSDDHRRTYTYNATVLLRQYAAAAKVYATSIGLPIAARIDPQLYSGTAKLQVKLTVDVLSRQLKKIQYLNQGLTETYSGYGTAPEMTLPAKTVSPQQLTNTLNSIQPR